MRHKLVLGSMAFAGVEDFPNIEAVQNYIVAINEFNWFRYLEATNVLGTKLESKSET